MAKCFGDSFSQQHRILDLKTGAHRARPKTPESSSKCRNESLWVGSYQLLRFEWFRRVGVVPPRGSGSAAWSGAARSAPHERGRHGERERWRERERGGGREGGRERAPPPSGDKPHLGIAGVTLHKSRPRSIIGDPPPAPARCGYRACMPPEIGCGVCCLGGWG
jgi:hypothetical protein